MYAEVESGGRGWLLAPRMRAEKVGCACLLGKQRGDTSLPLVPPVLVPDKSWPWEPPERYLREGGGRLSDSGEDHTSPRCVDNVPRGQASPRGSPAPAALPLAVPGRVALELAPSPPPQQRRAIKG